MNEPAITETIPHRGPMLLVDEVVSRTAEEIVCRKTFRPDEFFFQGHYPDYPLVPGVILCECAAQAAALLIGRSDAGALDPDSVPVLTRMNNVRFKKTVHPGDQIEITVRLEESLKGAWFLAGRVRVAGKMAVSLELACATAPRPVAGNSTGTVSSSGESV